jgi:hypothetical protein
MKTTLGCLSIAVLLLCIVPGRGFAAGVSENVQPDSIYEVSQKWMDVETELLCISA